MKTVARFLPLFLLFLVAACVPSAQITEEVSAPTSLHTATLPTAETGLTVQQLQNMSYLSPNFGKTIQLKEGNYSEDAMSISLLPQVAMGDLNGDQIDDAVVLLAENGGGTGTFVSLVVIVSQDGEYRQVGSAMIDDRPLIESLKIEDGAILLSALVHGINDAMVSPTLGVEQTYKLLENYLFLVRQSSTPQGGTERSISIDSPLDGSEVSGTIQLKGSMPIAPFENNLRLRIIDLAGTVLFSDGFMVTSADVGMPAVFDNQISLPTLPSGAWVRLELVELSMADGSMMDMNSVLVKIK